MKKIFLNTLLSLKEKRIDKQILYSIAILIISFSFTACKPKQTAAPVNETGTMTDRDGNVYATVKIGNQWWMAEDLKVKTYQNGDSVTNKSSTVSWQDTSAGYCISDQITGLFYNWYATSNPRVLAPAGWHVPSDEEWKTLETYLGMTGTDANKVSWRGTDQGSKLKRMKAANQIEGAWQDADDVYANWPTNESGFTALARGCRIFNGTWGDPGVGYTGFWWSSTLNNNQVWYRYLDYNKTNVFRFYGDKRYGLSVRCVKD